MINTCSFPTPIPSSYLLKWKTKNKKQNQTKHQQNQKPQRERERESTLSHVFSLAYGGMTSRWVLRECHVQWKQWEWKLESSGGIRVGRTSLLKRLAFTLQTLVLGSLTTILEIRCILIKTEMKHELLGVVWSGKAVIHILDLRKLRHRDRGTCWGCHSQVAAVRRVPPRCLWRLELPEKEEEGERGPGQGDAENKFTISRVHYQVAVSWKDSSHVAIF